MSIIEVEPSSAEYRLFVDLYDAARATRPSDLDRWNGKLYLTVEEGDEWGSLQVDGSFKMSTELVFDKLLHESTPQEQAQALTTILHEALHARVVVNAPDEPNAVLSRHSKALDEGLTEWVAMADAPAFFVRAGFGHLLTRHPSTPPRTAQPTHFWIMPPALTEPAISPPGPSMHRW
jgi:hypothetical protein